MNSIYFSSFTMVEIIRIYCQQGIINIYLSQQLRDQLFWRSKFNQVSNIFLNQSMSCFLMKNNILCQNKIKQKQYYIFYNYLMQRTQKIEIENLQGKATEFNLPLMDSACLISNSVSSWELDSKESPGLKKNTLKNMVVPLKIKQELQDQKNQIDNCQEFKIVVQKAESKVQKNEGLSRKQSYKKNQKIEKLFKIFFKNMSDVNFCANGQFLQYIRRKKSRPIVQNKSKAMDLGVCSLNQVLQLTAMKGIISYNSYLNNTYLNNQAIQKYFVNLLALDSLSKYDFENSMFCALDHRILCLLLKNKYPQEFIFPANILMNSRQLTIFYAFLYDLPQELYLKIFEDFRKKYNRHWMPKLSKIHSLLQQKDGNADQNDGYLIANKVRKLRSSI